MQSGHHHGRHYVYTSCISSLLVSCMTSKSTQPNIDHSLGSPHTPSIPNIKTSTHCPFSPNLLVEWTVAHKLLGKSFLPGILLASSSNSPDHHPSSGVEVTAIISPAWKSNSAPFHHQPFISESCTGETNRKGLYSRRAP